MKKIFAISIALLFFACSNDNDNPGDGGAPIGDITPGDTTGAAPNVNVPTEGKSADDILEDALESLKAEKWDEAIAYYDAAYEKDRSNPKAAIYSALANLAKISIDPKMMALMKDHFGFESYPNEMNALLSDKWLNEYDNASLPAIKTPEWVKGGKGTAYGNSLLGGTLFSSETWAVSLMANLVDKNSAGLNSLLDDIIAAVFGASYNKAIERLTSLNKESKIYLDNDFIDGLNLEEIFDENDYIGWAEVNALASIMYAMKAQWEWLAAYDWSIGLNWLKYSWGKDDLQRFENADKNGMPFNNSFMEARRGKMAAAKADYLTAIKGIQDSYTEMMKNTLYPTEAKDAYATLNGGFTKLIEAINGEKEFWIPEDITKGNWPSSDGAKVVAGIHMGKYFKEGYFSLQNMFETTTAGKPVFYVNGNKVASIDDIDDGRLQLNFNTKIIKDLIINDETRGWEDSDIRSIGLSGDVARAVYQKYY